MATLQELERRVSALEQAMVNVPGMQGGTLNPAAKENLKKKFMKNSAKKQEAAMVNVPGMQGGTLNPAAKEDLKNSAKKQEAATVKPDAE